MRLRPACARLALPSQARGVSLSCIGGTTLVLSVFPLYLLLGVMSSFNSKSRSPQKLDDDEAIRAVTF